MQKTSFSYEIILGDDGSDDGTREICESYAERFPDKIKLYLRDRADVIYINGHPTGRFNFTESLKAAKGKYIALCEGDDYWTDSLKLQKQVDFLEENEDFGICFHQSEVEWIGEYRNHKVKLFSDFLWNNMNIDNSIYTISDVFKGPFMATASVVFRRENMPIFPKWFYKVASADITLFALVIKGKKIKFLDEVMSVYRKHEGGVTQFHKGNFILLNRIEMLYHLNKYYRGKYHNDIALQVQNYIKDLSLLSKKEMGQLFKLYLKSKLIRKRELKNIIKKKIKKAIE